MRKVFLSSTSIDLAEYRAAVTDAIHGLGGDYHCIRMEDFGALTQQAEDFCPAKVRECHLFVGILGHLYGSCPEGSDKSYTEDEYDTAVQEGIPRLIFLASDEFRLLPGQIEPDWKRERQRAFRQRVSSAQIRTTFLTPAELASQVVSAIRNWEREQEPIAAWEEQARGATDRNPNLGPLVSKLCDRTEQEDAFLKFFRQHIKPSADENANLQQPYPHLYLIRGEESQRPESLVERLSGTRIQDYAHYRWGEQRGVVTEKILKEWPYDSEPDDRQQRLAARLFTQFDRNYDFRSDDFSPAAFARLDFSAFGPVIVLRHDIRAARWDGAAKSLIEWYLQFWDEVGRHAPEPQFLIFFALIHSPPQDGDRWKKMLRLARYDKKRIEKELSELDAVRQALLKQAAPPRHCPFLMMKELSCIERDHVMDWFDDHKIHDDDAMIRQIKCSEIFKSGHCRPMADIEHELKQIRDEFVKQRGYV